MNSCRRWISHVLAMTAAVALVSLGASPALALSQSVHMDTKDMPSVDLHEGERKFHPEVSPKHARPEPPKVPGRPSHDDGKWVGDFHGTKFDPKKFHDKPFKKKPHKPLPPVPEPTAAILLGLGLGGLAATRKRQRG